MVLLVLLIAGCGGAPKKQVADGPPDAVPRAEPKSRYGNMTSYTVFGKRYYTQASSRDHVERGSASWYGKKFHGRKTSSGERYDMHQMTAAHKTLPLPTYAMVTNLDNGRRVVVKVNDRGPFVGDRIIDLSYAAAKRLDMINSGIARVEVRSVDPRDHGKDGRDLLRLAAAAADTPASSETAKSVPTSRRSPAPMSAAPSAARTAAMQPRPGSSAGSSSSPAPAAASGLYVQVGAFGDRVNAEQLQSRLVAAVEEPVLVRPAPAPGSAPLYKVQVGPLRSPTDADALGRRLAALGINTSLIVTP
jgi:rare lipoprotein A